MRVVAAPDKFKGTLTAPEAASAMATGWRRADPRADVREIPVADGGDGTLEVLVTALGGRRERVRVRGPLGDPVEAAFGLVPTAEGTVAVVEMARASGLGLIAPERRDPLRASTYGTGELILAAARHHPRRILVCIGGSATSDAGAGMAQALGVRLRDGSGREIGPGGAELRRLASVDVTAMDPDVRHTEVIVASDVDNPLIGPRGAAAVYGPQKGADPAQVRILDEALGHCAAVVDRDLGIDVREVEGAGAAGGLGGGMAAFVGARIRPGFEVIAEALALPEALEAAEVAITGEGRFDEQTSAGKAPAGVLRMARETGCTRVLIAGEVTAEADAELVYDLAARGGKDEAMRKAREMVEQAAAEAAARLREDG
jgi:glycerate kinase